MLVLGCCVFSLLLPWSNVQAGEITGPLVGFATPRKWADKSGKFKIDGRSKSADPKTVQLLKTDGKVVDVPMGSASRRSMPRV